MKKTINVKKLEGVSGFFIKCLGVSMGVKWGHLAGWASAWDTIYIVPKSIGSMKLVAHELKHIEQMDRHGKLKFMVMCTWENMTVGYAKNKYEVEARSAEYKDMIKLYNLSFDL